MQELPGRSSRGRRHHASSASAPLVVSTDWLGRQRTGFAVALSSGLLALAIAVLIATKATLAQEAFRITAPPLVLAEAKSEIPLSIEVTPADQVPRNSFLRIRGLPPAATLSEGHVVAPGVWAVPLQSLSTLRLDVPAGASGRSDVTIALVTIDAATLAEVRIALVVASTKLIAPEPAPAHIAAAVTPMVAAPQAEPEAPKPQPAPPLVVTLPPQISQPTIVPAAPAPPPQPQVQPKAPVQQVQPPPPPPLVQEVRPTLPAAPTPQPPVAVAMAPQPKPPAAAPPAVAAPAPPSVAAPAPPPIAATAPTLPQAVAPPAAPPGLTPEARQRASQLLTRGNALLGTGDIAGARLFFERAADAGLAEGALALAATYDEAELRKMKAAGIRPDDATAKRWYERARALGSGEAVDRLKRLSYR